MFDSETSHFSFFDFLGYFIPGALSLLVIKWVALLWDIRFWGVKDWVALLEINLRGENSILFFIVVSYLAGHVVAFLSSVTVEVFSHKMYKFPSDFLLKALAQNASSSYKRTDKSNRAPEKLTNILYALIQFVLLPISLPAWLLGRLFHFEFYYLKPLDEIYAWSINARLCVLMDKLKIEMGDNEKVPISKFGKEIKRSVYNSDFHRIAYHYEYEKTCRHQNKLERYIALYDFVRAIAFLSVVLFWAFIVILTKQRLWEAESIAFMCFYSCLPYMFFMAFMKFYRRHTLETFMCLLVDEELASVDNKSESNAN